LCEILVQLRVPCELVRIQPVSNHAFVAFIGRQMRNPHLRVVRDALPARA